MALDFKDSVAKKTTAKRNIKITNVKINNGFLEDEEGNIANRLEDALLPDMNCFDIKITFDLPEDFSGDDQDNEEEPF